MSAHYEVDLSCGCVRTYSVLTHPFPGALLFCPDHGDVRSVAVEGRVWLADTREGPDE